MWVSTAKAGWPKAWFITTLAVLCPTPGSDSRASRSSGTRPPYSAPRRRESSAIARAFEGARPQERIRGGEERRRHAVHALVGALGRQNDGHQERERVFVAQRDRRLGMEPIEDVSDPTRLLGTRHPPVSSSTLRMKASNAGRWATSCSDPGIASLRIVFSMA